MKVYIFCLTTNGRKIADKIASKISVEIVKDIDHCEELSAKDILVIIASVPVAARLFSDNKSILGRKAGIIVIDTSGKNVIPFQIGMGGLVMEAARELGTLLGAHVVDEGISPVEEKIDVQRFIDDFHLAVMNPHAISVIQELIDKSVTVSWISEWPITISNHGVDPENIPIQLIASGDPRPIRCAYSKAVEEGIPTVFVTSHELITPSEGGYPDNVLVLVPRSIAIGIEISSKTNSDYVYESVLQALSRQALMPEAVSTVATSVFESREPSVISLARRLNIGVTAIDISDLRKIEPQLFRTMHSLQSGEKISLSASSAYLASHMGKIFILKASFPGGVRLSMAQEKIHLELA